jgi:hypothetical protein
MGRPIEGRRAGHLSGMAAAAEDEAEDPEAEPAEAPERDRLDR